MVDLTGESVRRRAPRVALADVSARYGALLNHAGALDGVRVLLIGSDTLELMCALIRRDCVGVAALRPGDQPERASADLVLIPELESAERLGQVLAQARRALVPLGSLVLCLPSISDETYRLVRHQVRVHGFDAVRCRALGGRRLLRAEVPPFEVRAAA